LIESQAQPNPARIVTIAAEASLEPFFLGGGALADTISGIG